MTRGAKTRGASRGRGKAKTSQPLADHKDPASDDSDDQTDTPADSNMKASESKGKSAKATKESRPENTEPQRDEASKLEVYIDQGGCVYYTIVMNPPFANES